MSAAVMRAVRGATTVEMDDPGSIIAAVVELLDEMMRVNGLASEGVVSAYFTATPDLRSEFPAKGARAFGWTEVPMLCAQEIAVEGAVPRCLRVLLHVEVVPGRALRPVYLREAVALRPDLAPSAGSAGG